MLRICIDLSSDSVELNTRAHTTISLFCPKFARLSSSKFCLIFGSRNQQTETRKFAVSFCPIRTKFPGFRRKKISRKTFRAFGSCLVASSERVHLALGCSSNGRSAVGVVTIEAHRSGCRRLRRQNQDRQRTPTASK